MFDFKKKSTSTQQTGSVNSSLTNHSHFGQRGEMSPKLNLKRTIGNQAVQGLLTGKTEDPQSDSEPDTALPHFRHDFTRIPISYPNAGAINAKLAINKPGDIYEQEADRVAEQVLSIPEDQVQRQAEEEDEEEEKEKLQAKELHDQTPKVSPNLEAHINNIRGIGQPLSESTRAFFEPRFGFDFSQVRVHTNTHAAEIARGVNARAFTVGRNIVFGTGQYAPVTHRGKHLIAHELAHVVQQRGGRTGLEIQRMPLESNGSNNGADEDLEVVYIVNWKAYLKDPNRDFRPIKKGKIKNTDARLRDEINMSSFKLDDEGNFIRIPYGSEVTIVDSRKRSYYYVTWSGGEGWTSMQNIGNKKNAYIPKNTEVTIVETESKGDYAKVKWEGNEGWIARTKITKFDLIYATTFEEGGERAKALTGSKTIRIPYKEKAKESFISAKEARALDMIIGEINNDWAWKRHPDTGESLKPSKLSIYEKIVFLQEREYENREGNKKWINYKVMDLKGNECWTRRDNISFKSPRIYEKGLIKGSILDEIKNDKVIMALKKVYGQKVDELLEGKMFETAQKELLERAKKFLQDQTLQSKLPDLPIPDSAKEEDGMKLNEDLIRRINVFYKFLVQEDLIDGLMPGKGIFGVRSFARAHEISTRWTLNPKQNYLNPFENKKEFVSQLIEIGGKDENTPSPVQWASMSQVTMLESLFKLLDEPETEGEGEGSQSSVLKLLFGVPSESCWYPVAEIEGIIKEIQETQGTQKAMAAEGYPKNDIRRRPNIRNTGISLHCGGEAIDIFFNFHFNYYDPIIDALALIFGLRRTVKDSTRSPEYWHYERVGIPFGERTPGEEGRAVKEGSNR